MRHSRKEFVTSVSVPRDYNRASVRVSQTLKIRLTGAIHVDSSPIACRTRRGTVVREN
jgi:hypothetical protein